MSTSAPVGRIPAASPRKIGRIAGICQLSEAVTATFGQVIILGRLIVADNAAATAANLIGHEKLVWVGFASSIIAPVFHIAWSYLMYDLLKPVNRRLAQFSFLVMLMGCVMQAVTALFYIAPLLILHGGGLLSGFTTGQLQSLAATTLKLNAYAFEIHTVYFGLWCVLTGFLIFKSMFLPRVLGILFMISGFGWLLYLSPPFAVSIFPVIAALSAIGEIPLELWLIVKSVDEQRWNEQAAIAGMTPRPGRT
jgi:hypothetical protein